MVWTPSRGGPVWQGPLTKHMYGLGPPKGGGEGGLGGYAILAFQDVLAGWHREGVLGPCPDGRPGRVWTPSWTGLGATLPGPSKVDFSSKDGGTPSFEGLGSLGAFFVRDC